MATDELTRAPGRGTVLGIDAGVFRIASVLILGSLMSVLDATIVNVALPTLTHDLDSTLEEVRWVVSAYLLAMAAVIPMTAWAARRFGPKQLYLVSIVLFTLGSALCGLADSTEQLIAFRIVQGIGGGMIMPVGQMILVKAAGPRNLARVMSVYGVPVVLAPVLGPTLGGLLLDTVGWRWIFYVNVPIGIVAVLVGMRKLHSEPPEDAGPFDLLGLVLVATGLVAMTYGLAEIGSSGNSLEHVVAPLVAGVVLIAAFVAHALRVERPLLDMRLYANRAFSASLLTSFCLGAALFGGIILMPLYFQNVRHEEALATGLLIAPRGLGAAIATFFTGRLTDRIGSGATAAIGTLVTFTFTVPFLAIGAESSYAIMSVALLLQGAGFGLSMMPAMTAAFRTLRPSQINDAAPQQNIIMRVGGSLGTAILIVVLQQHLSGAGSSPSAQADAFGATFGWLLGITACALIPAVALAVIERRQRRGAVPEEVTPELVPRLAQVE